MVKLEDIHSPEDVKKLHKDDLPALCDQLRQRMIETVSANGGHLASNLGVVELTVALHRVFTTPEDTLVWDVGHQCYAHKLLTGRFEAFSGLRRKGGISGFPQPAESAHDAFITGHSSTAISAANGIAKAKALTGDESYTVAILGDGAMTGGLAYEGLSNAGRSEDRLLVILNDNKMSISKNVGFVARYLANLRSKVRYVRFKKRLSTRLAKLPLLGRPLNALLRNWKQWMKLTIFSQTSLFENMGFHYMGPVDGHDLEDLTEALQAARSLGKPVLLHVATVKGKGYHVAEKKPDVFHGIGQFDLATGQASGGGDSFSARFGLELFKLAEKDDCIVAITAAMKKGTCLDLFEEMFADRFFDTGIAEGHAVTFASGLACGGTLPVFAVYSTFLQRGFDQLLNDTAIMNNHIVLAIDRAGIVPEDGETHQGLYDVAMLRAMPNTTVFAPANYKELALHLRQALYDTAGIAAVRYPKGSEHPALADYTPGYGSYDHIEDDSHQLLLITYGRLFGDVLAVCRQRRAAGLPTAVLKLNRLHPIEEAVVAIAGQYRRVLFFEEAARRGGVGEAIGHRLMAAGYDGHYALRAIDRPPGACTVEEGLADAGLDAAGIAAFIDREADHG